MTPLDLGDDLLTGATPRPLLTQGDNHLFVTRERGEPAEVFLGDDPDSDPSILQITHPDDGIQFWRRLARASIFGELTVQLGLPGRSFALGPDVTLEVGIVEVPSRSVRVLTERDRFRRGEGDVTLTSSAGYISGDVEPDLRVFGDGVFSIWWDGASHPWIEFAKTEAPEWCGEGRRGGDAPRRHAGAPARSAAGRGRRLPEPRTAPSARSRRGPRLPSSAPGQVTADDEALDLVGALEDLHGRRSFGSFGS